MNDFSFKLLANKDLSHVYTISGVIGSIVTYAFGGWSGLLEIFFIAMVFDWVTGIAASLKEGKGLSSEVGFFGGIKKALMIITVYFGHRVDLAFDLNWVMAGCIYFWLANELVSIAENFGRLKVPFPSALKKIISVLQEKDKEGNGNVNS